MHLQFSAESGSGWSFPGRETGQRQPHAAQAGLVGLELMQGVFVVPDLEDDYASLERPRAAPGHKSHDFDVRWERVGPRNCG